MGCFRPNYQHPFWYSEPLCDREPVHDFFWMIFEKNWLCHSERWRNSGHRSTLSYLLFLPFISHMEIEWLNFVRDHYYITSAKGQILLTFSTIYADVGHCWYIEPRNREKSLRLIWQHFSCLLDEWIAKIYIKKKFHDGFLR